MDQLTEADIPGSSLEGKEPQQRTNKQLQFWLKCRGILTTKLHTKAALIKRVKEVQQEGTRKLVDPTKEALYTTRKRKLAETLPTSQQATDRVISPPSDGWTQNLADLPEFNDINIIEHLKQSGKCSDGKQAKTIVRPDKRGYHFFTEKYLHNYHIQKHNNHIHVRAECYRSQAKRLDPHKVSCVLASTYPHNVVEATCSCVAGLSGSCNHVFALLHQTGDFSKSDTKCVPSEVSRTSTAQQWDKPRCLGVNPESIMNTTVQKAKLEQRRKPVKCTLFEARTPTVLPNNERLITAAKEKLHAEHELYGFTLMTSQDSEIGTHVQTRLGHRTPIGSVLSYQMDLTEGNFSVNFLSNTVEAMKCLDVCNISLTQSYPLFPLSDNPITLYDINTSADTLEFMTKHNLITDAKHATSIEEETRQQSQSESWFNHRRYRLTASRFHQLVRRRKGPCDLLVKEMINQKKSDKMPIQMQLGIKNEAIAIQKYKEYMKNVGHEVTTHPSGLVIAEGTSFLACSPDSKVIDPNSHPHFGLLEVKYSHKYQGVTPKDAAEIGDTKFCLESTNGVVKLRESHMYYTQVQGQMAVCGAKWCDFVVYTPQGLHIERITFNELFWRDVYDKLERFFITQFAPTVQKFLDEQVESTSSPNSDK